MNRTRNVVVNSIIMLVYQICVFISGFIIPGLILNHYGASIHGLVSIITSIMGYIALLNAGLTTSGIQALYQPLALHDENAINQTVNAINLFYKRTGYLYTAAVILSSIILPFIIDEEVEAIVISCLMFIIGMRNTLECFVYSKYKVLLQADQKLYIVTQLDIITIIIKTIIQSSLILLNFSVIIIYFIDVVLVLLRSYVMYKYVNRKYRFLNRHIKPDYSKLSQRWSAFVHQISTLVLNNTDSILILLYVDLKMVSVYTVYQMVFSHITSLINNVFSASSVASLGNLLAIGDKKNIRKVYNEYELLYFVFLSIMLSCTSVLILPFVKLYTVNSNINYVDFNLAYLFVLSTFLNNIRIPGITMITAAGHFKQTQYRALLEAFINLMCSIILVQYYGIYGVLLGTIISFFYRSLDIIVYSNHIIMNKTIKKTIFNIIKLICAILLINWIGHLMIFSCDTWLMWLVNACIVLAVSSVISIIIFSLFEFHTLKKLFQRFINPFMKNKIVK